MMAVTYRYPVASLVPDGIRALVGLVVTGFAARGALGRPLVWYGARGRGGAVRRLRRPSPRSGFALGCGSTTKASA